MAVTRIGSPVEYQAGAGNTGTVTNGITVPADAEVFICAVHGWRNEGNYFSGGTLTLDSSVCTMVVGADAGSPFKGALFACDARTHTGSNKSLAWDWINAGDATELVRLVYTFYKGVDLSNAPTSIFGDSEGVQDTDLTDGITTSTITSPAGTLIVAWIFGYSGGATAVSWTAPTATVTSGLFGTAYGNACGAWAEAVPTGNMAVAASWSTINTDGGLCALVLNPASATTPSNVAAKRWGGVPFMAQQTGRW